MRIALLGDIALFGVFSQSKNHNIKQHLKEVSEYLSSFDYVVGNLETPFSLERKTYGSKSAYICAFPEDISILKKLHINAVTLANNHMFDYGTEGYELTKQLLHNEDIEWFGTEGKELIVEKSGGRIAFAGFCCYTSNPLKCVRYKEYGVNAYNLSKAKLFIKHSQESGFLPVLAVHAGLEHVNYPSLDHIKAARQLASVGNYVYYGHHPHVIQGVEMYNGSLIAHSLGNFCFDDIYTDNSKEPLVTLTDNNRRGLILELNIENSKVVSWQEHVILITKNNGIVLYEDSEKLSEFNQSLIHCEENLEEYSARRNKILNERIAERRSKRDIAWYLKRLKPRYAKLIINSRRNAKLYKENVLDFINKVS